VIVYLATNNVLHLEMRQSKVRVRMEEVVEAGEEDAWSRAPQHHQRKAATGGPTPGLVPAVNGVTWGN